MMRDRTYLRGAAAIAALLLAGTATGAQAANSAVARDWHASCTVTGDKGPAKEIGSCIAGR